MISVSNLIDNSFLGSKDSPGALHCKLGALAFSASSREFPSASSGLNWQLLPGQRPEVVRRGPVAVSTMFAGFKEPTRERARKGPQETTSMSRFLHVLLVCTDSLKLVMWAVESLVRPGSKATATVLACRHFAETMRSVHRNFGLAKIKYPLEGQKTTPNSHMRHKQVCELNSSSPSCGTSMLPTLQ